jgi:uncharacterized protein (TIGR00645 family)
MAKNPFFATIELFRSAVLDREESSGAGMYEMVTRIVVASRLVMIPLIIGLVFALMLLVAAFFVGLWHFAVDIFSASETEIIIAVLALIDLTLIASLMITVIFSSYSNFVQKIDRAAFAAWPQWMSKITSSDLKEKLFASMIAITGVTLLKALMKLETSVSETQIRWLVIAHVIFVASYVALAAMERFSYGPAKDSD